MMGYIYKITNKENGHIYIGQTIKTPAKRFEQHVRDSKYKYRDDYNTKLHRAIRKYGPASFECTTIEECDNELLNEREIYWINHYDTFNTPYGYNCTTGGGNGYEMSASTRSLISEAERGSKNHYFGKHLSPEHRRKIGDAQRAEKGNMFGKHHTEEQIQSVKILTSSPVVATTKDGNPYMYFLSSMAANRCLGVSNGHINHCLHGIRKVAGKAANGDPLSWRYATDQEKIIIKQIFMTDLKESIYPEDMYQYMEGR